MCSHNHRILTHCIIGVLWLICFFVEGCYLFVTSKSCFKDGEEDTTTVKGDTLWFKMVYNCYNKYIQVLSKSVCTLCFHVVPYKSISGIQALMELFKTFSSFVSCCFFPQSKFPFLKTSKSKKRVTCKCVCVSVQPDKPSRPKRKKKQRSKTLKDNEQKMLIMFWRHHCFW